MAQENKFIKSLIQSAQHGNNAALEQLFEMNIARVFGLCLRVLGNEENAEAITVLVFIEAWKQIKFIRPDISFTEWLCSMAVWNSLELIRSGGNTNKSVNKKKIGETDANKLMLDDFDKELMSLSDKERLPFVLNKIEGYKEDETGDLLSVKHNELRKKLDSACKHLARHVGKINSTEEITSYLTELKREIKPVRNLKKVIFDDIYELKLKELEKNKKPEPVPEPEPEPEKPIKKKEKKPKEKKQKKKKAFKIHTGRFDIARFIKPALMILIPVAALSAIVYFGFLISASKWDVEGIKGNVKIDGSAVKDEGTISLHEVIVTGDNSSALVLLPDLGTIEIEANSKIKRTNQETDCEFESGQIKVTLSNIKKNFTVKLLNMEVSEYAKRNTYTLKTLEDGKIELDIIDGILEVKTKNRRTVIPKNYFLYISESTGCGLPCAIDAPQEIKNLISDYITQGNSQYVANLFISSAGKPEVISLWNLLPRMNPLNRNLIYEKINSLVGIPESVTKDGIVNLDEKMMDLWLNQLISTLQ